MNDVDAWDGYVANRRRVLDTINENNIDNVVILSGDSQCVAHGDGLWCRVLTHSANWVSDLAYDNRTGYDYVSGNGALGVEFAGTAVSSPPSYGYNTSEPSHIPVSRPAYAPATQEPYPLPYYTALSNQLVAATPELQWAEGATRGYCTSIRRGVKCTR